MQCLESVRIPPVLIKASVLERIRVVISQTSVLPHSLRRKERKKGDLMKEQKDKMA